MSNEIEAAIKRISTHNDELIDGLHSRLNEVELEVARQKSPALWGSPEKGKTKEDKVFNEWLRKGALSPDERKVLTVGSDPSFGFACPPQLSSEILHALTEGSPMRGISRIFQTSNNSLEILKKSASGAVVYQTSEVSEILETTGLAYAKLTLTPKTEVYLLKASVINLEDAVLNIEAEISQELGEAFGTFEANQHINGTEGILANIGDGTLNTYNHTHVGSTTVFEADDLIALTYAIPTRFLAGARFIMNRATMSYIRQLKSATTNMYLLDPLSERDELQLCGYPVTLNDNMPNISSGLYPVGFGNWQKAFGIVDRYPAFTVQRMAEAFAIYGIVGFLARFRTTHGPLVGEAAHFLQMSA
jgi:HK97 family phage major capsid protein